MKKIFITFFFSFLFIQFSTAQVSKGMLLLSGDVGLGYQSSDLDDRDGFTSTISPFAAYFISDHVMLGGGFSSQTLAAGPSTITTLSVRPLARYYFNPSSTSVNYFAQAELAFGLANSSENVYTGTLGVNKFLNPNVALEGGLNYTYIDFRDADGSESVASLTIGITAFLSSSDRESWGQSESGIGKGVMMIGMSGANLVLIDDFFSFSVAPNVGYFLTDNIMFGGTLGLRYGLSFDDSEFRNGGLSIQPFVRYYFNTTERLNWFAEGAIGYARSQFKTSFGQESESDAVNLGLHGGANLFLTPNFALEFTAGWNLTRTNSEFRSDFTLPTEITTEETINDFGFNIGFQYFWNRGGGNE